jgi:hypothetical protein
LAAPPLGFDGGALPPKGDPFELAEFPGVDVPGEPHVFVGAPGWPVVWPEGVVLGHVRDVHPWGVAKADRVPKADSMGTTIAEAITATRIYCIITVYCLVLYKEDTRIPLLGFISLTL